VAWTLTAIGMAMVARELVRDPSAVGGAVPQDLGLRGDTSPVS
jgi:hypothetical protein